MLVASPQMVDPFFGRAVILLCEYGAEGAMGLVINRPLGVTLESVLLQLEIPYQAPMSDPVLWGGPVMPETGFLICRDSVDLPKETLLTVTDDLFVSSSKLLLERAAQGRLEKPYYLCLGYAGWGPGQLDTEIQRGTWIWLELDDEALFTTAVEKRWDRCIATLGVSTEQIFMSKPVDE